MTYKLHAVLAAALAFAAVPAHAAINLVDNPGFETGTFSQWTQSGNLGSTSVDNTAPAYVHSGTFGAKLGPEGQGVNFGHLTQSVETLVGNYVLTFWWRSNGCTSACGTDINNTLTVNLGGPDVFQVFDAPNSTLSDPNAWTKEVIPFTASGNTLLDFKFEHYNGYYGLDDISIMAAVPEPETYALMLAGLGVVGFMGRRRKAG